MEQTSNLAWPAGKIFANGCTKQSAVMKSAVKRYRPSRYRCLASSIEPEAMSIRNELHFSFVGGRKSTEANKRLNTRIGPFLQVAALTTGNVEGSLAWSNILLKENRLDPIVECFQVVDGGFTTSTQILIFPGIVVRRNLYAMVHRVTGG